MNVLGERSSCSDFPANHFENQQKTGYTSLKSHDCQVTRPHSTPYDGDPRGGGGGGGGGREQGEREGGEKDGQKDTQLDRNSTVREWN